MTVTSAVLGVSYLTHVIHTYIHTYIASSIIGRLSGSHHIHPFQYYCCSPAFVCLRKTCPSLFVGGPVGCYLHQVGMTLMQALQRCLLILVILMFVAAAESDFSSGSAAKTLFHFNRLIAPVSSYSVWGGCFFWCKHSVLLLSGRQVEQLVPDLHYLLVSVTNISCSFHVS